MGREIRRVPPNWEHPKVNAEYFPLHDQCYEAVAQDWDYQAGLWERYEHPDQSKYDAAMDCATWEEWHGERPDPTYYRHRCWGEDEATSYQIYENVTEGTPLSPVLPDIEAVRAWLFAAGYSRAATEQLINSFYLPTFYGDSP